MPTLVVNMSGREFTTQEINDLSDQFFTEDADYIFHDVDQYDRYRHERGISPLSSIVDTWLKEAIDAKELTYEDQLVLFVPVDTPLFELHQMYNVLLHSWLVKPPRFIFSYAYIPAGSTIPAMFTHQEITIAPAVKAYDITRSQRPGLSLVDIKDQYLPNADLDELRGKTGADEGFLPFKKLLNKGDS